MSAALDWLLTYLVHSTVLLGGALLVTLALRDRRLGLQEAVLRAALVGGFVTAGLQVGAGVRPWAGSLRVHDASRATGVATPRLDAVVALPLRSDLPAPAEARPSRVARAREAGATWWRPILLAAWACLALVGLARLGVALRRLRRLLADRRLVESGALPGQVAALAATAGLRQRVRVSATHRLSVPLATGLARPEVCLPERVLAQVDEDGLAALCAHEVAHLARRDPAWILVARLAACLVPLQPLNAWAARRLGDLAECLADDLAVAASARPLGLARSLVEVAAWAVSNPQQAPATAAAAFRAGSRLRHRVERLMDPVRRIERPSRALLPLAAAAALATALVAPVVASSDDRKDPSPPPAAPPAPAAPAVTSAPPAPPVPPAPPAPPAPRAPRAERSDAERRMEELTRRIRERALMNRDEIARLRSEIEALRADARPRAEDVERQRADALRLSEDHRRAIEEKARALAELARPTAEEEHELERLAGEIAEEAIPDPEELAALTRHAMDTAHTELERALESTSPELERAKEELRRAAEQLRRAAEEYRAAAAETRRRQEER
jgi:beta-lactamase regulating signal transducer with metallopeptidase domain